MDAVKTNKLSTFIAIVLSAGAVFLSTQSALAEPSHEIIREHHFKDGAIIRVHTTEAILKKAVEDTRFPGRVLKAAVSGYETITQKAGFSSDGYSFAKPDKNFAYDPDKTIDIYLGLPDDGGEPDRNFHFGFGPKAFKDTPCFDTLKISAKEYHALVLLPANYREFIRKWEKINPSSLGARDVNVDLKGTLIHEMLHVVLFYYNRNLDRNSESSALDPNPKRKADWYVEGLARYFETLAGARHDFFSQGFKQTLPGKICFSRGGSNYFMRYPDQSFSDLRYENALFWKFIHGRFGLEAIERLSRGLRDRDPEDWPQLLENAFGVPMDRLMGEFALAGLLKDFLTQGESAYLKEMAMTRLAYRGGNFYLLDGRRQEKLLGPTCATDWIGQWDDVKTPHGAAQTAGDNTPKSDVSGWASDFYEIDFRGLKGDRLPWIGARTGAARGLFLQAMVRYKNGTFVVHQADPEAGGVSGIDIEKVVLADAADSSQVEKVYFLVTNQSAFTPADYQILSRT